MCLHLLICKMEMIAELPWQIAAWLDTISQCISPSPAPFTTCSINVKHHWQSFTSEPHLQEGDNYTPGIDSGWWWWEMNDKNVCKVASISNEQRPHRSREPDPCVNSSVSPPESPREKSPDVFPNCQYLLKIAKAGPALCQFLREQLRFCLQQLPVCIHTGLLGEPQNNKIMLSPDSNSPTLLHFINYTCLLSWVFPTLITKGNEG